MDNKLIILMGLLVTVFLYSGLIADFDFGDITAMAVGNDTNDTADNVTDDTTDSTTNNTTVEAGSEFSVELDKDSYNVGEVVSGTITLVLDEGVDPDEPVTVTLNDQEVELTLLEVLESSNHEVEYMTEGYSFDSGTSATELELTFTEAGEQYFAFYIPRYSTITDIEFSVTGSDYGGIYPNFVELDFGEEDSVEWNYIGEPTGWNEDYIYPSGIDHVSDTIKYIQGNDTYTCELVSLPYGKDFKVLSRHEVETSGGDLYAVLLSTVTGDPLEGYAGGEDVCDLPESESDDVYESCDIEMEYPIEGDFLACIYSLTAPDDSTNLYELPADLGEDAVSAYTCDTAAGSNCYSTDLFDYFILVDTQDYDSDLQTTESLDDWLTGPNITLFAMNEYVGGSSYSSSICEDTLCFIPVKVKSNSSGVVTIDDLYIEYDYSDSEGITSQSFYPATKFVPEVETVNGEDVNGTAVGVLLDVFGLSESVADTYQMIVEFDGERYGKTVNVGVASLGDDDAVNDLIDSLTSTLEGFQVSDEAVVMGAFDLDDVISDALEDLESYSTQLDTASSSEIETLYNDVQTLRESLPQSVVWGADTSYVMEMGSVPADISALGVLDSMQDYVAVEGLLKKFTLVMQNGDTYEGTFIEKEVEALNTLSDVALYEIVDASGFYCGDEYDEISSGVYEFVVGDFSQDDKETISYVVETKDISLDDTETFFYANFVGDYTCGNEQCEARSGEDVDNCPEDCGTDYTLLIVVLVVVLLLVALVGGVYYMYHKGLLKNLFKGKKKSPFKDDNQLASVVNYVKAMKAKGMPNQQIKGTLAQQGWKTEQIEYAFKKS